MSNSPKLIKLDLPEEIFDSADAYVMRRKRIPVFRVDAVRQAQTSEEVYENLAAIFPEWENVLDIETGDPLCNPSDDPSVFGKLDSFEQLPWLAKQLQNRPNGQTPRQSKRGKKLH